MFAKLENLEKRYVELEQSMADPAVLSDMEQFRKTAKSRADLEPVVLAFREYRDLQTQLEENKELLSDDDRDIRDMAQEEIQRIEKEESRHICVIGALCGTDIEPQDVADQARRLEEYGVILQPSNAKAALLAGLIVS